MKKPIDREYELVLPRFSRTEQKIKADEFVEIAEELKAMHVSIPDELGERLEEE